MTTRISITQLYYITFRRQFVWNQKIDDLTNSSIWVRESLQVLIKEKDKIFLGKHVYKKVIKSSSCSEIFCEIFPPAPNCLHEGGQGRLTLWLRKHLISTRKKIENSQSYMKN